MAQKPDEKPINGIPVFKAGKLTGGTWEKEKSECDVDHRVGCNRSGKRTSCSREEEPVGGEKAGEADQVAVEWGGDR